MAEDKHEVDPFFFPLVYKSSHHNSSFFFFVFVRFSDTIFHLNTKINFTFFFYVNRKRINDIKLPMEAAVVRERKSRQSLNFIEKDLKKGILGIGRE